MRRLLLPGVLLLLATAAAAQQADTLRTTSTLVLVPTRVTTTSSAGLNVTLRAEDFTLTDNGVPQKLRLEEASREPLAVIVLLQTGGAAPKQFANYAGISSLLEYALGSVRYRVSLITFDSKPEDRWPFSNDATNLRDAFQKPKPGDGGAAVLDAIDYGLDWFGDQHPRGRRLILLVSDEHFRAGDEALRQMTRRLAETNTTIYSLSFNAQRAYLIDELKHSSPENPPLFMSPDHPPLLHTFNLDRPLRQALSAMQSNAAEGVAALSGGTYMPFTNRKDLELQLTTFANDLSNRYILSFQPTNPTAGLHSLQVSLPQHPDLQATARTAYWHAAPDEKH
ncbi:von Willebrand factor type A-like protein [Terriglobus roseus DSM 18391]|uniref:von Willebrand factor type A-like protein n=1 Tax=Terriglobus roseus (strain DSM 18391 / NRRL B-41598 / KBS 63) TaxID=926566 RepID=I3ZBN1_TERRK|nr:VWA domain-containing protein [Terriglobus roseus]AFL86649.1 von Willebrand factor type A-like protein [Terriglobus roseus DSM 18391]